MVYRVVPRNPMSVRMVNAQGVLTRIPYAFYAVFIAAELKVHWLQSVIPPVILTACALASKIHMGACVGSGTRATLHAAAVFHALILLRGKTA